MRKMITGVLVILLLMMSGTTMVFAAENKEQTPSVIGRVVYSACVRIDLMAHFTAADGRH